MRSTKIKPYDYQADGFNFLQLNAGTGIIADDMGLGKTFQSILWCEYNAKKALIVCPASLQYNWSEEIEKFTHSDSRIIDSRSLKVKKRKIDYTVSNLNYLIISFSYLQRLVEKKIHSQVGDKVKYTYIPRPELFELVGAGFDTVIIDEAHYMSNPSSIRARAVKCINSLMQNKIPMTGTPIKSKPVEFFPILEAVAPQQFNNWHHYVTNFCGAKKGRYGYSYNGATNLDLLHKIIQPYYIRRKKEEVLDSLPEKTRQMIKLDLSQCKEYDVLVDELKEAEEQIHQFAILTKIRKALSKHIAGNVVDFAQNIIENSDSKIIVGSMFLDVFSVFRETFGDQMVEYHGSLNKEQKNESLISFRNDPRKRIIVGTISSMGVGLNITAADKVLVNDTPWTPADCFQFEDRAYRNGQKNNVNCYYFGYNGTYHDVIFDMIQNKNKISELILDGRVMTEGHVLKAVIKYIKNH